ncbi:MAG: EamA family transporter RarD [Bacillota bacterium]
MNRSKDETTGIIYGVLAYTVWGILPLYWKLLNSVASYEILAHRIFWSFIFVAVLLYFSSDWEKMKQLLSNRKNIAVISLCSIIVTINWGIYIWAVNSNQVIEASMGYYINPLVVFLFSVTILKERLNKWQVAAILLAGAGVLIITLEYGKVPWIALGLALSFALYGLIKKLLKVDSLVGLALETAVIAPFAFSFIIMRQVQGAGALGSVPIPTVILLVGSGIATATPLLWFAQATQRVKFSTIGFLQYIAPTLSLLLGVVVFKEPFMGTHLLSFSLIWLALIIYSLSNSSLLGKKIHHSKAVKEI